MCRWGGRGLPGQHDLKAHDDGVALGFEPDVPAERPPARCAPRPRPASTRGGPLPSARAGARRCDAGAGAASTRQARARQISRAVRPASADDRLRPWPCGCSSWVWSARSRTDGRNLTTARPACVPARATGGFETRPYMSPRCLAARTPAPLFPNEPAARQAAASSGRGYASHSLRHLCAMALASAGSGPRSPGTEACRVPRSSSPPR